MTKKFDRKYLSDEEIAAVEALEMLENKKQHPNSILKRQNLTEVLRASIDFIPPQRLSLILGTQLGAIDADQYILRRIINGLVEDMRAYAKLILSNGGAASERVEGYLAIHSKLKEVNSYGSQLLQPHVLFLANNGKPLDWSILDRAAVDLPVVPNDVMEEKVRKAVKPALIECAQTIFSEYKNRHNHKLTFTKIEVQENFAKMMMYLDYAGAKVVVLDARMEGTEIARMIKKIAHSVNLDTYNNVSS